MAAAPPPSSRQTCSHSLKGRAQARGATLRSSSIAPEMARLAVLLLRPTRCNAAVAAVAAVAAPAALCVARLRTPGESAVRGLCVEAAASSSSSWSAPAALFAACNCASTRERITSTSSSLSSSPPPSSSPSLPPALVAGQPRLSPLPCRLACIARRTLSRCLSSQNHEAWCEMAEASRKSSSSAVTAESSSTCFEEDGKMGICTGVLSSSVQSLALVCSLCSTPPGECFGCCSSCPAGGWRAWLTSLAVLASGAAASSKNIGCFIAWEMALWPPSSLLCNSTGKHTRTHAHMHKCRQTCVQRDIRR